MEQAIIKALAELRKEKSRKFDQTIEAIINLKKFDIKKESVNLLVNLPYPLASRKICGFLTKKSSLIDTILKSDLEKYKNKKEIKKLVKSYDFFVAHASLMPSIATSLGKYLGPAGKMPSPQLGVLNNENDDAINQLIAKINHTSKIKSKEPSLKIPIGKASMKDEEIAKNFAQVYQAILNAVSKEKIKSVLVKFTMTKPVKLQL